MTSKPYAWHSEHPRQRVARTGLLDEIVEHLRQGSAVKVIGGRGMGKSVLLHDIEACLRAKEGTRVVLVAGPPEQRTVVGAVRDLAFRLGVRDLSEPRLDDLLDIVLAGETQRLIVLLDETDQYVSLGADEDVAFARSWLNKLEVTRKEHDGMFDVVFAGGLGLLYLEREVGSGLVSRAEPCVLTPFSLEEIRVLAEPFARTGRTLSEQCLAALLVLSGGNPALVTYGLERLWAIPTPGVQHLEHAFSVFRSRHASFVRAVRASVSQHGRLDAPWRVLEIVRQNAGGVPLARLRQACAPEESEAIVIDPEQALDLLRATGLVKVEGDVLTDPVVAWPVASILNLPDTPSGKESPEAQLVQDVCAVLQNMRRFGRDFYDGDGLIQEEALSSIIAVGLRLLGWGGLDREVVQVSGFADIKVRLSKPGVDGHAIIETKIWRNAEHNRGIQDQIRDYRVADTRHAIAITLGTRGVENWPERYEEWCLTGRDFIRLETPPDMVGRWQVTEADDDGRRWLTDHLVVQLPKRR